MKRNCSERNLSAGSNLDFTTVFLSALKAKLDESLDLYADVILNPAFPEADFKRQQSLQLAAIENEKSTPVQMALRVMPPLLSERAILIRSR